MRGQSHLIRGPWLQWIVLDVMVLPVAIAVAVWGAQHLCDLITVKTGFPHMDAQDPVFGLFVLLGAWRYHIAVSSIKSSEMGLEKQPGDVSRSSIVVVAGVVWWAMSAFVGQMAAWSVPTHRYHADFSIMKIGPLWLLYTGAMLYALAPWNRIWQDRPDV